ncbi:hypothetical protein C8R21_1733 [Nitrosospira multiformis]|uniref:Uncharacterized protein n=1 Tax=Nitrosospira multiformis TaxID=1231 RepID=A0A2T5HXC5_9PROT|nr:hypothetical protein C8R21_1733 [Nitrosospira multiformis]
MEAGLGKKFRSIDAFNRAAPSQYRMLPCRFVGLDGSRYVMTNEAGEHLVVTRPQLEQFVRKSVLLNSDYYNDLKSKHFLIDDDSNVALDLLALKYRTKAQQISQFT